MRRRELLTGVAAITGATAAGGSVLWSPAGWSSEAPVVTGHDAYFGRLNRLLKTQGPGRPVMLIDRAAMLQNAAALARSVGPDKTWRVVVKSLPSVPLLRQVMQAGDTSSLMVFHQPFLNEVARSFPQSDVLIGKPMPVAAVRTFFAQFAKESRRTRRAFDPQTQIQWLVDSRDRLLQYQQVARELGVKLAINFEIDVGLHRGGLEQPVQLRQCLEIVGADNRRLAATGLMGYEPHLTGMQANLDHPAVRSVLGIYRSFVEEYRGAGYAPEDLTLNGAGSHTLRIYEKDRLLNDLAAGSGVVMPTDFDTHHLAQHRPALFIATPILKRYEGNPYIAEPAADMERLFYIYGGYWKAGIVSPAGTGKPIYQSTNQSPVTTSRSVTLGVDDYMFLRPTQSEFVMLQFGDLLTVDNGELGERWPVFQQTG